MGTPFELSARCDHHGVAPGRGTAWIAINIDPRGAALERARAPLALALVVDTSGSMHGDPLAHARAACEVVVGLLGAQDQLAIVTFGTHAALLHGLTPVDAAGRATVGRALATLATDGNTNLHGGLQVAAGVLATAPAGLRRAIVLLSDGQPNVGLATAPALAEYVATLRPIGVSTLGFGLHHDERVLAAIADAGSGRYAYVPDPLLARVDLARAALAHGGIVADSLELSVEPAPGVELLRVVPAAPMRVGRGGVTMAIGDVFVDEGRLYALELALDLAPGHRGELARVAVRGRAADGSAHAVHATVTVDVRAGAPTIDPAAARDVWIVQAEAARREARALVDRGAAPGAAALLRQFVAALDGQPWFVVNDGSPLADLREQLIDDATNHARAADDLEATHQRKASRAARHGKQQGTRIASTSDRPDVPGWLIGVAGPLAGRRFELDVDTLIGRSQSCAIAVPLSSLSGAHARIVAIGPRFVISDLGSTHGTTVNGARITSRELCSGDEIALGGLVLRFEQ